MVAVAAGKEPQTARSGGKGRLGMAIAGGTGLGTDGRRGGRGVVLVPDRLKQFIGNMRTKARPRNDKV